MSRVSLNVSYSNPDNVTVPGYNLSIQNVSLSELALLQIIEEILTDCLDHSRISTMKLETKLEELKESYRNNH